MNTEIIKAVQLALGLDPDGVAGDKTWAAIHQKIVGDAPAPALPSDIPGSAIISGFPQEAIDLILASEGVDQPSRWPGGNSGITLGYGCDIGADPGSLESWRGILSDSEIAFLQQAKGKIGSAARDMAVRFVGITVSKSEALKVFMGHTLPAEIRKTVATFPGINLFPPAVLGAMTSIVYNRGTDISASDPRRAEMLAIHDIIKNEATMQENMGPALAGAMTQIAAEIRGMKRLWINQGLDGLLTRRDAEAAMVTRAIPT